MTAEIAKAMNGTLRITRGEELSGTETAGTRILDRMGERIGDVDRGHGIWPIGGVKGVGQEIGVSHGPEEGEETETETGVLPGIGGTGNGPRVESGIVHGEVCHIQPLPKFKVWY